MSKKTPGYVYLIKPVDHNVYKIGCTVNLTERLIQNGKRINKEVEYVHYFKSNDYEWAEQRAHILFSHSRICQEWFALSDDEVKKFCEIKDFEL